MPLALLVEIFLPNKFGGIEGYPPLPPALQKVLPFDPGKISFKNAENGVFALYKRF